MTSLVDLVKANPIEGVCLAIVMVVAATSVPRPSGLPLGAFVALGIAVLIGLPLWWLLGTPPSLWPHVDVAGQLAGGRSWP